MIFFKPPVFTRPGALPRRRQAQQLCCAQIAGDRYHVPSHKLQVRQFTIPRSLVSGHPSHFASTMIITPINAHCSAVNNLPLSYPGFRYAAPEATDMLPRWGRLYLVCMLFSGFRLQAAGFKLRALLVCRIPACFCAGSPDELNSHPHFSRKLSGFERQAHSPLSSPPAGGSLRREAMYILLQIKIKLRRSGLF